jgi:phospholipid/cholesterol/gamma-HCH transport system substrate-binding protein
MHLDRRVLIQLAFFVVITVVGGSVMVFRYMDLPNLLFGVGHYRVTVQLPATGGLYKNANVTYRGTDVGRVLDVRLTDSGVDADLSLESSIRIPRNLDAQVHSQTAIGEQYVALLPRGGQGPALANGDVIPLDRASVPPDINTLLDATNRGLEAIPGDNLNTAVNEAATAVGGLGPELSRLVRASTTIAIDAQQNLDSITTLIDGAKPVLDSQTDTAGPIRTWAANLAAITGQLQNQDVAVRGVITRGGAAADEVRQLFDRMQPTLRVLLANLVSIDGVALTYQPNLEQILALVPEAVADVQGAGLANRNSNQGYRGSYLSFNLNINLPPPCTTGFLPAQQQRVPSETDYPDRPAGAFYCRIPQDSMFHVRGARNLPCETRPGKRAPTVRMCESDENYVPLNDGWNWKGDPNATTTGQSVPQVTPESTPTPPASSTGSATPASPLPTGPPTWQSMLTPAEGR